MKKRLSMLVAIVLVVLASLLGITGNNESYEPSPAPLAEVLEEYVTPETEIQPETEAQPQAPPETEALIDAEGSYTTKEDVALYIHTYGCLPGNFMTKKEARALGWEGGGLDDYAPGMCIGGDHFGNYEGLLPEDRDYTECDIDTLGAKSRGAKRIVFSEDGLIYYTDDHYESFELLYGEP